MGADVTANKSTPTLIRGIREKAGWTQEKLAQEVGVSFLTANSWERGKHNPQLYLFKEAYGTSCRTICLQTKR